MASASKQAINASIRNSTVLVSRARTPICSRTISSEPWCWRGQSISRKRCGDLMISSFSFLFKFCSFIPVIFSPPRVRCLKEPAVALCCVEQSGLSHSLHIPIKMICLWIIIYVLQLHLVPSIAQEASLIRRDLDSSSPSPISADLSQYWYASSLPQLKKCTRAVAKFTSREGNDGPWSSFVVRVGTPAQDVRTFVSTSSQISWIVLQGQGCRLNDGVCAEARGGLYNMNTSSTWRPNGFWQLGNERNLGIYANGLFGNDTIGLGIQGSGGPTLEDQIMAVIRTEEIYVGMFAVNPKRTNYTGITEQGQASYMTTLKNQSLIPSVSLGYTAGASYRLKRVLGSLTLGGYDQARFTPNNMTFSFASDTDRDIVVGIQSITSTDQDGTKRDLLPTGINAYVDSTVPQIWLPLEACKLFENAFGLTYDPENQLYPVSNTLHKKLLAQNASITFTLAIQIPGVRILT